MKLRHTLSRSLALACFLAPGALAQRVLHENPGTESIDENGYSVAAAGDLDGDGIEDYWMSAPKVSEAFGQSAVFLCSGADGHTLRRLDGNDYHERFGFALAGGRDLSGDGQPDLLVGVSRASGAWTDSGAVRVFSGADGALLYTLDGSAPFERFGESLAFLDDRDGDGVADFVVGAPGDDQGGVDRGSLRVFSGASGGSLGTIAGSAAHDEFGTCAANVGDIDGDGQADCLVGAPHGMTLTADSGLVVLLSGADGSELARFAGDAAADDFGRSVAGLGDADADGVPDLLVGAPGGHYARVLSGADASVLQNVSRTRYEPENLSFTAPARFGWAVSGAGDLNDDGHDDFAVGYPEYSGVWLFSGSDATVLGLATCSYIFPFGGEVHSSYFGWSLARLGDVDGDGHDDLVVGAPLDSISGENPIGSATVLSGGYGPRWLLADEGQSLWSISGAGDVNGDGCDDLAASTGTGIEIVSGKNRTPVRTLPVSGARSLSPAGDVDGDGVTDLVIGTPGARNGNGGAWIYSGASGAALHHLSPVRWPAPVRNRPRFPVHSDRFGTAVAGVGDVNGDGRADVAVGAPRAPHPSECIERYREPGYVALFSGADGALLWSVVGAGLDDIYTDSWSEAFGFSVSGVGDWNRDGVPDLAVGAPGGGYFFTGQVHVLSGVDGRELDVFSGGILEFGIAVSGASDFDVDGDGYVDLVVGDQDVGYGPFVQASGRAWVFSSNTKSLILAVEGSRPPVGYGRAVGPGYSVAALRDFDGDGRSDFVLGNPAAQGLLGRGVGEVTVHSGRNGSVIGRVSGTSSWDYLGYSVAAVGDTNGDGASDVFVLAPIGDVPGSVARARVLLGPGHDTRSVPSSTPAPGSR